jgi:peptidoglycan-N-acetylglucosamine deacetylase
MTTRRTFLRSLGLSTAGFALGGATLASYGEPQPIPIDAATIDALEVRKAIPLTATESYAVSPYFVTSGPGFGRRLALTFDDGPAPGLTDRVLAELRQRNIKATFYLIGNRVKSAPDLAAQTLAEGHELGNHSTTHPALGKLSDDRVESELRGCQEAIHAATGALPVWFRPPYGSFQKTQGPLAMAQQLGVCMWSVDPQDWRKPGIPVVQQRILTQSRPGSIVLMHDIHKATVDALPGILDGLLERGYEFTTISGFLGHPYVQG